MEEVAPSGVVTFLFTDIEGSTRRWEADPNTMRGALVAHDTLLNDAVLARGGYLFKHTGDGICAAFASPRSAVDAAVSAQRELKLPVRMGIATGEAERRGDDYFGAVLNRAARVMAAGHGGQILLDATSAGLLSGVDLLDLGLRQLRDIEKAVNIFQVRGDGLRSEFPPLKTLDSTPGNLRVSTTAFFGREAEIADVQTSLKAHRLVTLTGPGGVGKTRLALEVAQRSAFEYSDGVWVIELAPVGDPAAIAGAVAAALGVTQQPGMNLTDSVAAAQQGRSRLFVFDNCEHILDAAADVIEKILQRSSTVSILATSREGLRLADERIWPVPSLDIDSSATQLFAERASAVGAAITSADGLDAVAEICRRLDGIPLAIELAASRMQSMTVAELQARLHDRFRLLTGARRGLERHQTLRHAVQWSFDLLTAEEQSLLARISVFAGGFDLAGACAITGSGDELATLDLLAALVRKSLLIADRSSGQTRFSMLETIRQFADERLIDSGEAPSARAAHAHYFAAAEDAVLRLFNSPHQREAYEWLARELPNVRAAFRWAVDGDDLDTCATIAFYTALLGVCCDLYEPVMWAEELVSSAAARDHPRLVQLCAIAAQLYAVGRVDDAIGYAEMARDALDRGGYTDVPFGYEVIIGTAYHLRGEPDKTAAMVRDTITRTTGSTVLARAMLAMALTNCGAVSEAMTIVKDLPIEAETVENPQVKCLALNAYGWAHREADPKTAYEVTYRAMLVARASGNRFAESTISIGLSRLAVTHGDPLEAIDHLVLAIRNYQNSGSFLLVTGPLSMIAVLLARFESYEAAATIMGCGDMRSSRLVFPEVDSAVVHLREVLGDQTYESLTRRGAAMTTPVMVAYAFDQIERLRTALEQAQNPTPTDH
ncbi:adenylate/guanylate cyclase domain-containing protein [Mycobacterium sp. 1274761.0]|uniref:ATP-binding protein n=1 Tax=Mycobacterium sp. 1274761.0 TaxID=1834077 RepID=UPI0007FE4D1B|nr:adenylate/guanylate cyclase domain-containing protein [Mycobacterium sp. 1274761.0]OBK74704.1 cyclase [Mycobacterium sp. 1274761.0]